MPDQSQYRQLAEWAPHAACWTAFPYSADDWFVHLKPAQAEFKQFCAAIVKEGKEALHLLVANSHVRRHVERDFADVPCTLHQIPYGDIWLRDIAPVFVSEASGKLAATCFQFNGWGGKYPMPGDERVAVSIARELDMERFDIPLVLEGGSIDADGEGTCLTTEQCLLNPNRNPGKNRDLIESTVAAAYGVEKILWLNAGLLNDHTDGHIDNIARFTAPGKVICMAPQHKSDPNYQVLVDIIATLESFTDAKGRALEISTVPSVGTILDEDGRPMPASYMNFYIANDAVIVPLYQGLYDEAALEGIGRAFPGRKIVGLSARAILTGGGSFHCITQQQPIGKIR